jgi:hypothetical protein
MYNPVNHLVVFDAAPEISMILVDPRSPMTRIFSASMILAAPVLAGASRI